MTRKASKTKRTPKGRADQPRFEPMDVQLGRFYADPAYQRPVDQARVRGMAADLQLDPLATVMVNVRPDGTAAILDGQQRIAALQESKLIEQSDVVTVMATTGLDLQGEAAMFRLLNENKHVTRQQLWMSRRAEGDKTVLAIDKILEQHGLRVYDGQGSLVGAVRCIASLERTYWGGKISHANKSGTSRSGKLSRQDAVAKPGLLRRVLEVITGAWGVSDPLAFRAPLVDGIATVCRDARVSLDVPRIQRVLSAYPGGPDRLWADARMKAAQERIPTPRAVSAIVRAQYNFRLSAARRL